MNCRRAKVEVKVNQKHKLSLAMTWVLFRGAAATASRVIVAESAEGGAHRHTLRSRGPASVPVVAGGRVSVIGCVRSLPTGLIVGGRTHGRLRACESPFDIYIRESSYLSMFIGII